MENVIEKELNGRSSRLVIPAGQETKKSASHAPISPRPFPDQTPSEKQSARGRFFAKRLIGGSLRVQIGLLYVALSIGNITFFSGMILENQMDLLISNFRLESHKFGATLEERLSEVTTSFDALNGNPPMTIAEGESRSSSIPRETMEELRSIALSAGVSVFVIFDKDRRPIEGSTSLPTPKDLKERISELQTTAGATRIKYQAKLDTEAFKVEYLFPFGKDKFFYTVVQIETIQSRLNSLYFQLGLAILWGIVFHIAFGIYLFRKIFKRLALLQNASSRMAMGELGARALWTRRANDELDTLGRSFNAMADKIQETIEKLGKANKQMHTELSIGKQIQGFFLPDGEILQEFKPAVLYLPMRQVSGDIYNFYRLGDPTKGEAAFKAIFLADATGHGVSAALITSVIFFHLDSILKTTLNPSKILKELSYRLHTSLQGSFFATAIFLLFDDKNNMYFTNAGHNPAFYVRTSSQKVVELDNTGFMLGLGTDMPYEAKAIKTQPGDKIFLYTDGIVEAPLKSGGFYGVERFREILINEAKNPNYQIITKIQDELLEYCADFNDDITLLALEVPQ